MRIVVLVFCLASLTATAPGQTQPAAPDLVIFVNGEQLSGQLEKADGSGITFKSAMVGELTVKWDNIREVRSEKRFALLEKNKKLTHKNVLAEVSSGPIEVADKRVTVGMKTIPLAETSQVIPGAVFDRAVNAPSGLLHGWAGPASFGLSVVNATQNTTTFNGAVSLTRSSPQVDWLPPRDRTLVGYTQTYGNTTQTGTPTIKTNIFHASAEEDEYLSPRIFVFGSATFDHNFSQNLDIESAYGGGFGITLINSAKQQLDLKGDGHYLMESFFANSLNPAPSPNVNVVASSFTETYVVHLPKALLFSEFGSISPSWTNEADFAAHVNGSLVFPVIRGFGFDITAIDDFLNNAPAGTKQNSTQLNFGITYAIKPR